MYVTSYRQVGDNIAKVMAEKGMSHTVLAERIAISETVAAKIIQGRKAINLAELSRIANILDTTVENLLTVEQSERESKIQFSIDESRLDESVREKLDIIRQAITEITLLEELSE